MPTLTIHYETEGERLAYERAVVFVAELHQLGMDCPADRVVDACEDLALGRGRDLIRDALADAIQARVDQVEKKGARPDRSTAAMPGSTRADTSDRC